MRLTEFFAKTRKDAPKDEVAKNAQLLIRAGYIHKDMAGVYSLLPLGLQTVNNIVGIIREEMKNIGGHEVALAALQNKDIWEKTDRWDDKKVDNWFKTEFKTGGKTGLGITHEEPLTAIMREYVASYRDLPIYAFQFQTKFRNETRAKSGILRGKEFLMKDLYSFCRDAESQKAFYDKARGAYITIFDRLGIGAQTYPTFASGGIFSKYSEEFQTLCEAGEDIIYVHEGKKIALNKEVYTPEVLADLGLDAKELVEKKAIEVGNIFTLGTKFSEPLELTYKDEHGKPQLVHMGSYGIGPTRVMGTIAELCSDDKGLVWPKNVAPIKMHLVVIKSEDGKSDAIAELLYSMGNNSGLDAIIDDRDARLGEKLGDAELIGAPMIVIVSPRSLESGGVECINRKTGEKKVVSSDFSAVRAFFDQIR